MIWPYESYSVLYDRIKKNSASGTEMSVMILAGPDVDALCSVSILTSLFKADYIPYSLTPIHGPADFTALDFAAEVKSLVLIQCGAASNLCKILALRPHMHVYVIDSHRPLHLANVYDTAQIFLMTGTDTDKEFPEDGSDLDVSDFDDSEGESDDDDDDAQEGWSSDEEEERQDESLFLDKHEAVASQDHEDENSDPQRFSYEALEEKDEKERPEITRPITARSRVKRLCDYYRGSYHDAPASATLYTLASQRNVTSSDPLLLWYAIIGVTKQFIKGEIDSDSFQAFINVYHDEVMALHQASEDITLADGTVVPSMDDGKIIFEEDYRFMLYRHWNLYDSMYHSSYVASKLSIWKPEVNRDELELFLAKMGFSLKETRQKFAFMSMQLKTSLKTRVKEIAPEFGLDELFYGSFRRQYGFKYQLSAADVVYAVSALLEAPMSESMEGEGGEISAALLKKSWKANFHQALGALPGKSLRSTALLETGLTLAKECQTTLVKLALSIMERKLIYRIRHFRYAVLKLTREDQRLFRSPTHLSQLALFLVDIHREGKKWTEEQGYPLVLVLCLLSESDASEDSFVVAGVTCPQRSGDIHRNHLGTAFKLAVSDTPGVSLAYQGFETSVLHIQTSNDIHPFLEQLHNVMNA